jgi:mannose-6-phosphate isomerase-like protein (cupin superfamily)
VTGPTTGDRSGTRRSSRRTGGCTIVGVPRLIPTPSRVTAAGEPPKTIDEYVGRVNSGDTGVSLAHMRSPSGWSEPGQRPEFAEYTLVLRGALRVEHESGELTVEAGQAVHTAPGEWVRYSSPGPDGAEYVAVCLPAFDLDAAHRD